MSNERLERVSEEGSPPEVEPEHPHISEQMMSTDMQSGGHPVVS